MSARLVKTTTEFCFGFRCNACSRPEVIALTLPDGWEALSESGGPLLHRCPNCRFWNIVEALEIDLEWRSAEW